jgi:hypothetical protein
VTIIDDLASEGIQAEELAGELVIKALSAEGQELEQHQAEVDVVVRLVNEPGFVVGSIKTHVVGDSDIGKLEKKIREQYAHRLPFAGHRIQPAFMAETVKTGRLDRLKAACKARGVRLCGCTGRALAGCSCAWLRQRGGIKQNMALATNYPRDHPNV